MVKRLNASKIYTFEDRFVFAGAGPVAHIEQEVNGIMLAMKTQEGNQRSPLNVSECEEVMWRALLGLHGKFNVERSRTLGVEDLEFFSPLLVAAGRGIEHDGKKRLFTFILHTAGVVERVDGYGTVGSGAAYAELLLKNTHSDRLTTAEGAALAAFVIGEVKAIDPNCGGPTQVATLTEDRLRRLPPTEVEALESKASKLVGASWDSFKKKLGRELG